MYGYPLPIHLAGNWCSKDVRTVLEKCSGAPSCWQIVPAGSLGTAYSCNVSWYVFALAVNSEKIGTDDFATRGPTRNIPFRGFPLVFNYAMHVCFKINNNNTLRGIFTLSWWSGLRA